MTRSQQRAAQDLFADPFGERSALPATRRVQVLGAHVQFETRSRALLRLVDAAYAGLPRHRLSASPPRLRVRLLLFPGGPRPSDPPAPVMFSSAGLLVGAEGSAAFVAVSPRERTALVALPPELPMKSLDEMTKYVNHDWAQINPLRAAWIEKFNKEMAK